MLAQNKFSEAASQYREALRIQPDSTRAHLGLGIALVATGDRTNAVLHLQHAVASPEAPTRDRAADLLRQLGSAR